MSRRERRLWVMTAVVVLAIYSTLGLARTMAEELRNRELLDAAFVTATIMILLAAVALAWQTRPTTVEIGVALGVVAVYVLVAVRMALPEERTHLIEYGVVAAFIQQALTERKQSGAPVRSPSVMALILASVIGAIDEFIQLIIPSRVFDPLDVFVNVVSAAMAIVTIEVLSRARRRLSPDRSLA